MFWTTFPNVNFLKLKFRRARRPERIFTVVGSIFGQLSIGYGFYQQCESKQDKCIRAIDNSTEVSIPNNSEPFRTDNESGSAWGFKGRW